VRWVRSGTGGAVLHGLGCAWGETNTVAMTCAFTLGAIPSSSFGAMSTIVNEPLITILGRVVIAYSRRNAE
jgi:ABC-type phosphate transport system permease subunit